MKKILLGTSAIVGASVLLAAPAFSAEKPKLTMDGWLRFEAWSVDQDNEAANYNRGYQFDMDDVEIHFLGSSKADNGLEYGFYVELIEGDSNNRQGATFDEANVFFAGGWGKLELGSNDGVENNWKPGGYSVSADKDGAWDGKADFTKTGYFVGTDLGSRNTGDANKITYYTPSFSGFSAGVSLTPDSSDYFNDGMTDEEEGHIENAISAAVQYKGDISGVGIQVAARMLKGEYQANDDNGATSEQNEEMSWGIGGVVSYAGFSLGASYTDHGDSGVTKANEATGGEAAKWYDVGLGYATGPYKVSVGYMHSEQNPGNNVDDSEVDYYSLGFGYAAAPGLDIYATYQYVDLDAAATTNDNEVNMFMVGTQVSF